jgi:hypothetical protein
MDHRTSSLVTATTARVRSEHAAATVLAGRHRALSSATTQRHLDPISAGDHPARGQASVTQDVDQAAYVSPSYEAPPAHEAERW